LDILGSFYVNQGALLCQPWFHIENILYEQVLLLMMVMRWHMYYKVFLNITCKISEFSHISMARFKWSLMFDVQQSQLCKEIIYVTWREYLWSKVCATTLWFFYNSTLGISLISTLQTLDNMYHLNTTIKIVKIK
jgi:hypothetical protein